MAKKSSTNFKSFNEYLNEKNTASSNNVSKQVANYQTRLASVGKTEQDVKDKRNPLEKALNLKQDQNALFDIMELLNRPQQALFRGIESAQQGEDFLEGMRQGITGEATTNFGDILRNAGVDDTTLFTDPFGEERSLADVLGLAGDIFLDPIDLVPVGAIAGKAGKGIAKGLDKGITKGLDVLDNKALRNATEALAKESGLLEAGAKLAKSDVPEMAAKLADKGIDVAQETSKLGDTYKAIKKGLSRTVDYSKSIPDNLYKKITEADNGYEAAAKYGENYINNIKTKAGDYLTSKGATVTDDALDKLGIDIQKFISSKYAPEVGADRFLEEALKKGKNTFSGSKEEVAAIANALEQFKGANNITNDVLNLAVRNAKDGATLTVKTGAKKGASKQLKNLVGNEDLMKQLSDIKLTKTLGLNDEELKGLQRVQQLYNGDSAFKALVDEAEQGYSSFNNVLKEVTGGKVSFDDMLREGYTRSSLTDEGKTILEKLRANDIGVGDYVRESDEVLKGSRKTLGGKTYSNYTETAERQLKEDLKATKLSKQKEITRLQEAVTPKEIKRTKSQLAEVKDAIKNADKNYQENLAKLSDKMEVKDNLVKLYNEKIDNISDIVNDKVLKKANEISDPKLINNVSKASDKYNKAVNQINDIKASLSKKGLTTTKMEQLTEKLEKAQADLLSKKADLVIATEKITDGASEKFIKDAKKIANDVFKDTSGYTKRAMRAQEASEKLSNKVNALKNSYGDTVAALERQQANLELQLKTLMSKAKKSSGYDQSILDRIGKLQKDIDLLDSAEGIEFFNKSYFQGFGDFIDTTTNQAKALNTYNEVLLHSGLNNPDVMKVIKQGEKAEGSLVGMKKLSNDQVNTLKNYLNDMKNFLPEDSELIKDLNYQLKNANSIYLDKGAYELMNLKKVSEKELNPLLDMVNSYNNMFKKYSVLSPGFQLRNMTGNATNMYLSGVPAIQIPILYGKSNKMLSNDYINNLFTKKMEGTLSAAEKADYDILLKYIKGGFAGQGKDIRDLGEIISKVEKGTDKKGIRKAIDNLFSLNAKGNEFIDSRNRMALLLYAEKNPKYLKKLGATDSIDAVKKVLFDPKNMSPFEKNYLKKVIPFYTFTKQNLVFQANNIMKNTPKYNRLVKTFNKAYEAAGEGNYRQYQKENFELPLFKTDSGLISAKTNLPLSDLGEYMENPLQRLVSGVTPLIKTPFELVTGKDTFTGQYISDRSPLDTIASATGLSGLTTKQYEKIQKLAENGDIDASTLATMFPSVFRYADAEKIQNSQLYEDLLAYQQYIKKLKNQGIDVPTIKELNSQANSSLKKVKNRRTKSKR